MTSGGAWLVPSTTPSDRGSSLALLERLGLRADLRALSSLSDAVGRIAAEQGLTVPEVYARCLSEPLSSGLSGPVAERMSVSESSFFRHQAHFDAIERTIIPGLRRARPQGGMRVLSAGCAKGEELYSLAITCHRAWPEGVHSLLGLDVSEVSLRAAAVGRYRAWSMRGLEPANLSPWLTPVDGDQWEVSSALRGSVELMGGNLLSPPPQLQQRAPFDLILCRNVLIYFSRDAGRSVARGLARLLAPGGVLVVGPADHDFCVDLACRQKDHVYLYSNEPSAVAAPALTTEAPGVFPTQFPASPPPSAGPMTVNRPPPPAKRYEELLTQGRAARDHGREEEALQIFDQSIALIPERPEGYFEQALLLDHRRLFLPAREMLERALYLDPCFVPAMVILSRVLSVIGHRGRARAMLESLEAALRDLSPAEPVTGWVEMTAGSLHKSCQRLLRSAAEGSL